MFKPFVLMQSEGESVVVTLAYSHYYGFWLIAVVHFKRDQWGYVYSDKQYGFQHTYEKTLTQQMIDDFNTLVRLFKK